MITQQTTTQRIQELMHDTQERNAKTLLEFRNCIREIQLILDKTKIYNFSPKVF